MIIQSDGSLTHRSKCEIRRHLPHAAFLTRESTEALVRERASRSLLRLIGETNWWVELKLAGPLLRFPGKYVILFDSDLLFMKRPDAVVDATTRTPRRAFHSPGGNALAEPFHELGFDFRKVDIRSFNAGFIGFQNDFTSADVEKPAEIIRARNPQLFNYYDIEQALWSVLMNRCHDPFNLKALHAQYVGNGWSQYEILRDVAVMAHFVGATRFRGLKYVRLARRVIDELARPKAA